MCTDCGCSIRGTQEEHSHNDGDHSHAHQKAHEHLHNNPQLNDAKTISVIQKILDKNDHEANHNRSHLDNNGILGINLMSSPGSGKTALLEHLVDEAKFKFAVIEGDLETSKDADRLKTKVLMQYRYKQEVLVIWMLLWCIKLCIQLH